MKTSFPLTLSVTVCGLALRLSAPAQTLSVDSLVPAGNQMTITVRNTGTATAFQLQTSPTMATGTWIGLSATFAPVPGPAGFFRATFTPPAGGRAFFRVLGTVNSSGDADGDGLADAFETTLGTNPNLFDTDGDGFDDGTEFSFGTNPVSNASFPSRAALPAVEFADSFSSATEGGSAHTINITSTPAFSGPIRYAVSARSTGSAPGDFQTLSGSVAMVNGLATVSVALTDDLTIKGDRLVFLDLDKTPPGNAYRPAGATTHILRLTDNDRYWSGNLAGGLGARTIRLRVLKNAAVTQIDFVSGTSDGLPRTAATGTSSQSTGVIPVTNLAGQPQEIWPATGAAFNTGSLFSANVENLRVVDTSIIADEPLKRSLQLTAQTSNASHRVTDSGIIGQYTEQITHATDPSITYLNRSGTGTFILRPDLPTDPVIASPFAPNN